MEKIIIVAVLVIFAQVAVCSPYPRYPLPTDYEFPPYPPPFPYPAYPPYAYPEYLYPNPAVLPPSVYPPPALPSVIVEEPRVVPLDKPCGCPKSKPVQVVEELHPVVVPKAPRDVTLVEDKENQSPSAMASAQTVVNVGMHPPRSCAPCADAVVLDTPCGCDKVAPPLYPGYYPSAAYPPYYPPLRQ